MKTIFIKAFTFNLLESRTEVVCVFEMSYFSGKIFNQQTVILSTEELPVESFTVNGIIQAVSTKLSLPTESIGVITELSPEDLTKVRNIIGMPITRIV